MFYKKQAYRRTYGNIQENVMLNTYQHKEHNRLSVERTFLTEMEQRLDKTTVTAKIAPNIFSSGAFVHQVGLNLNNRIAFFNKKTVITGDSIAPQENSWSALHFALLAKI